MLLLSIFAIKECLTRKKKRIMKKFYLLLLGFFLMVLPSRSQATATNSADVINYASHFQNIPKGALGLPNYLVKGNHLQIYQQLYAQSFADTVPEIVIAQLEQMKQLIEQEGTPKIDVDMLNNKYYRLYSVIDSAKVLSVTPAGKLTMTTADELDSDIDQDGSNFQSTDIDQLWQIRTTSDGKLTIYHANHDAYAQAVNSVLSTSTSFTLDSLGYAQFSFTTTDGKLLTATSDKASNNTAWYIVPVKNIRLRLESLGTKVHKTYGSTYLPFNISRIVGAQAYVGCEPVKNCMNLNAVDDFARATGVVLISDDSNDYAYLTIGGESANNSSVISGTFKQQTIDKSLFSRYLILDEKLLFRPYIWLPAFIPTQHSLVKANTAYFYSETGSTIYFEEVAEDADKPVDSPDPQPVNIINVVEKNASNAQSYYDLSGRRVMQPVKGGVYIQGGKKIVVR